jgi:hypothetical protein
MKTISAFFGLCVVAMSMVAGCTVDPDETSDVDGVILDEPTDEEEGTEIEPAAKGDWGSSGCGECFRAIQCVAECDGRVVQTGCCSCPDGTVDKLQCGGSPI